MLPRIIPSVRPQGQVMHGLSLILSAPLQCVFLLLRALSMWQGATGRLLLHAGDQEWDRWLDNAFGEP
jgi:hypothetical protein